MGLAPLPEHVYLTSDGEEIETHTVIESSRGGIMFHTRVVNPAIEVHSSFVTSAGGISAAHLLVGDGFVGPRQTVEPSDMPFRDVDVPADRSSFLLDHLAQVRDAVAAELGQGVRLELRP
jgi:hypothetical protein